MVDKITAVDTALEVLTDIAEDEDQPTGARIEAAREILKYTTL